MNKIQIDKLAYIQDIAPKLVENFTEIETSKQLKEAYYEKIKQKEAEFGLFNKYFFGHSHDSAIIALKKSKSWLTYTLNDYATFQFAQALIRKKNLKITEETLQFPVDFEFFQASHVSLNQVEEDGKINKVRFRKADEYLYEEILTWEPNQIEIAFDLWKNYTQKKGQRYLLLIACKQAKVTERQDIFWQAYFGKNYAPYYTYFKKARNQNRYLSDFSECVKLIDEFEEKF